MNRFAKILFALTIALLAYPAGAQQDSALILADPAGRPTLVKDAFGNWTAPVSVYSDDDVELFVPDTLTLGGIPLDGGEFRRDGTYATYLYSFYKNDHDCRKYRIPEGHESDPKLLEACALLRYQRRVIKVDTRKKTLDVVEAILMYRDAQPFPNNLSLKNQTMRLDATANPVMFKTVNRITALIARQVSRGLSP